MRRLKNVTLMILVGVSLSLCSCANVTPVTNERETISYDGNDQTAGVLDFLPDGSLKISPGGRERYNALIKRFGKSTIPETQKDFGVKELEDGNYSLTLEGAERWFKMNRMLDRERVEASDNLINKIK